MKNPVRRSVMLLAAAIPAAIPAAEKPVWRDPLVTSVNRLPARAVAVPCETARQAREIASGIKARTASPWIFSLNGEWRFRWKRDFRKPGWEKEGTATVPGCWQLQGDYDPPLYTNVRYPIAGWEIGDPCEKPPTGYTSEEFPSPAGLYSRKFTLPESWKGRRTAVHFGGFSSGLEVRVNGKDVGYAEDGRLPAEFDITPFLREGENEIEACVLKHTDGTFLEDQDFWRLSGLFRDVWLVSEAHGAPADIVAETTLSDDFAKGALKVVDGAGGVLFEKAYENPALWSDETPNLYCEAFRAPGGDWYAVQFGFRRVEIKDAIVLLNGKRIAVRGVNRHEMEPDTGYAVSPARMRRDIELFKELNINAVRTCHYPNDPEWYSLCDRAGIIVCCEANVETHGAGWEKGKSLAFNPLYRNAIIERAVNMVKTFRNHPSIIFWSLGNESGGGGAFAESYDAVRALDPARPVQYEGACRAGDYAHSDILCPMYWRVPKIEKWLAERGDKPVILCEYAHAMGNSNGDFSKYAGLFRRDRRAQGGFIWDFADQALWKKDASGERHFAYGGDFGDVPNDGNFNCNGIVSADRLPHPGAYEVRHFYSPVRVESFDWDSGRVKIANEWRFKSADGLWCIVEVFNNGEPAGETRFPLDGLAPESAKEFAADAGTGDCIRFTIAELNGVSSRFRFLQNVSFDRISGVPEYAKAVRADGAADASRYRMNFWRAPTDNDRGWKMGEKCAVWKNATAEQRAPKGAKASLKVSKAAFAEARSAEIVELSLKAGRGLPPLPRVGVSFRIPGDFTQVEWRGLGPHENYSDRQGSAMQGVWKAVVRHDPGTEWPEYAEFALRKSAGRGVPLNCDLYVNPGEQGHRCGCRALEFTNGKGGRIRITALDKPFGFNAWPYSQKKLEAAAHQHELETESEITVNIDTVQMGVGGDNSWGFTPWPEHMPGAGTYSLRFLVERF